LTISESLYAAAAEQQDQRLTKDPWEDLLKISVLTGGRQPILHTFELLRPLPAVPAHHDAQAFRIGVVDLVRRQLEPTCKQLIGTDPLLQPGRGGDDGPPDLN
jgi:hypothetical protein